MTKQEERRTGPHALYRLSSRVFNTPLAILPEKADTIAAIIGPRAGLLMENLAPLAQFDTIARQERKPYAVTTDGVAIIDISGVLANRSTGMEAWSGMSSYEQISNEVLDAATDPAIKAVLLRVDSPGGEVHGMLDAANLIREARAAKPIWASVDDCACSAAYALASAAERVLVTQTSYTGSVGVIAMHVDQSGFDEQIGLKYTMIFAGARKADFNEHEALSKEARTAIEKDVDEMYGAFVALVVKNRGIAESAVRSTEAQVYRGADAVGVGFADEQSNFREALAALTAKVRGGAQASTSVSTRFEALTAKETIIMADKLADKLKADAGTEETATDPKGNAAEMPPDPDKEKEQGAADKKAEEQKAAAVEAAVTARMTEITNMVALAGAPTELIAEYLAKKLTPVEVSADLLKRRADGAVPIRSGVVPGQRKDSAVLARIESSAADLAMQGKYPTKEQAYVALLKQNPQAYFEHWERRPSA